METTSVDLNLSNDQSLSAYQSAVERSRSTYVALRPERKEQPDSEPSKLELPHMLTLTPPSDNTSPSRVKPREWKHPSDLDHIGSLLLIAGPPPEEESSSCKKCIVGTRYPSMHVSIVICALIISVTLFPIGCIACCWVSDPKGRQCDECGHRDYSVSDLVIALSTMVSIILWTIALQLYTAFWKN